MTVNNFLFDVGILCADAEISNGDVELLWILQKMANISWLCGLIFLNPFGPAKKINSEQFHQTYYAAKFDASVKKKDFVNFVQIQT